MSDLVDNLDTDTVKAFQRGLGVEEDGWIGPKPLAAYIKASGRVIVDRSWQFSPRKRRHLKGAPWNIVLHDSVTRSARACFRVLKARHLSTHYIVCESGKIYETLDPELYSGAHARRWNTTSIGIDVVSMVSVKSLRKSRATDIPRLARVIKQRYRPHNKTKTVVDYTPEQVEALANLVNWLCDRFDIPKTLPTLPVDYGWKIDINPATYKGVVAHGQISSKRWDGGMAVVHLSSRGFKVLDDE